MTYSKRRALAAFIVAASTTLSASPQVGVESIRIISSGARVDWAAATSRLAIDRRATDGFYELYTLSPGEGTRCLACSLPLSQGHVGNPAWHPSGAYLVFQAQDTSLEILPPEKIPIANKITSPGWGTNNNLWIATWDGTSFWQLTHVAAGGGTLHPHFSPDGTQLLWAEKIGLIGVAEQWTMRLADVVWENGTPHLEHVIDIAPLGIDVIYETHGFTTPDDRILFSTGLPDGSPWDVYAYDRASGEVRNFTGTPTEWDEHAQMSPTGDMIVWASSRNIERQRDYFIPFLDLWVMNSDGSGQQRLTFFNEPGSPHYYDKGIVTADISFSADGTHLFTKLEVTVDDPRIPRGVLEVIALIKLRRL